MAITFTDNRKRSFGTVVDPQVINEILEEVTDVEIENLEEIIKQDSIGLKKIAALYLQKIQGVTEQIQQIEAGFYVQKKLRKQIMAELKVTGRFLTSYETDEYKKNKDQVKELLKDNKVKELYKVSFNFHDQLNEFLGQKVKTILVLEDDEGNPIVYEVNKEDLFNNNFLSFEETSKSARLAARFKTSAENMFKASIPAINRDNLIPEDPQFNLKGLNLAYKIVLYRFDTYNKLVLWEYPDKIWNKMKVSARGDISEAYASFFLRKTQYKFNNTQNKNIDDFMMEGVYLVDNVSGLLQGDVEDGIIQYAIKSADASYMSILQMITLAQRIVNEKNFSVQDLQKEKSRLASKKQKARQKLERGLIDKIDDSLQEAIRNSDLTS